MRKIKEAKGNNKVLLALNMKLSNDMSITGKDKQDVFKLILKNKK